MPSGRHCRSPHYRNGSKSRDPVPLRDAIFRRPRSACLQDGIVVCPITATAANPVIRCRCGMPVSLSFCRRSFPCWKVPGETAFRRHLVVGCPFLCPSADAPFRAGRCRVKRLFAVTFSNSLSAGPRQRWLLVALHRFPAEKVPANVALHRHLLEFVISWSASEVAPGGPAPVSCGEGDGQIAVPPSPSRIRYQPTCLRGLSRCPMQDPRLEGAG